MLNPATGMRLGVCRCLSIWRRTMVSDEQLQVEKAEYICTLTINRPERRNALTIDLMYRLGDTLRALGEDGETRVVVMRGAGEKAFCAGMDLRGGMTVAQDEMEKKGNPLDYLRSGIIECRRPVIAMICGAAVGAGCDVAAACDIRMAADNARMGINPVKMGSVYWPVGTQSLTNVVGRTWARELFFTGRFVEAAQALRIGLVNHVVPAAELHARTYALAQEIAENGPLAVAATKAIFNRLLERRRPSEDDVADMMTLVNSVESSADRKEGLRAFIEKRKPDFAGR